MAFLYEVFLHTNAQKLKYAHLQNMTDFQLSPARSSLETYFRKWIHSRRIHNFTYFASRQTNMKVK